MRCNHCGKESETDEFEQQSRVGGGSRYMTGSAQEPVTYWICGDCANYRRGTFRLIYWLAGGLLILGLIALVAGLISL
jgi:hypothetical protein